MAVCVGWLVHHVLAAMLHVDGHKSWASHFQRWYMPRMVYTCGTSHREHGPRSPHTGRCVRFAVSQLGTKSRWAPSAFLLAAGEAWA